MPDQMTEREATRKLHFVLLAGLTVVGGVMLLVTLKLTGPGLPPGTLTDAIGYVLAALGFSSLLLGVLWARGRIPPRGSGETVDAYWKPSSRARALVLWILCEGSGIIGAVGFHLTGGVAPLALFALAWLAQVWYAPSRLEA